LGDDNVINNLFKSFLFLLSYLPLFVVFAINNFGSFLFVVFSVFSLFVVFGFVVLFSSAKRYAQVKFVSIERVSQENVRMLEYIFVYIIPFIGINGVRELISVSIILVIVGSVYVKTDLIVINPVLSLFGYNIYKIEFSVKAEAGGSRSGFLISKKIEDEMRVKEFNSEFYLGAVKKGE
jgi:hypothetical protein